MPLTCLKPKRINLWREILIRKDQRRRATVFKSVKLHSPTPVSSVLGTGTLGEDDETYTTGAFFEI